MTNPPPYFDQIRKRAVERWDQLERDPDLAGPWHQLFKQVQSPRHVLSELLQNADDAEATEASARIERGAFIFEHNGKDFTEDEFASLCRFGYSNKRMLHTIGFRGIGFKSAFSLGDRIELFTPSLSVYFDRRRFTEPVWLDRERDVCGKTRICVALKDAQRLDGLEKNLSQWQNTPASLLFFRDIRRLHIRDQEIHWCLHDSGPVPNSHWMVLNGAKHHPVLLIRSHARPFPSEAIDEIRQERLVSDEEMSNFPPATIEIVLGGPGQLFVVLPTGVQTALPFAVNAPFIQDPARLKLRDPETSSTNRWLLEWAGRCAADAMLKWLGRQDIEPERRAAAYSLLPPTTPCQDPFGESCSEIVRDAIREVIADQPVLLAYNGRLVRAHEAVIIPEKAADIWAEEQVAALLDEEGRPALSRHVNEKDKLICWGLVQKFENAELVRVLTMKSPPRPRSWEQLLVLWDFLAPDVTQYWSQIDPCQLHIIPVEGQSELHPVTGVVRLGKEKLLQTESDWQFLAPYLTVLDRNWIRFLGEQGKASTLSREVEAASAILNKLKLERASDVSTVIDRVAAKLFTQEKITLSDAVRLAQIAAKVGAEVGESFRYVSRDEVLRPPKEQILLFDADGTLEELVPEDRRDEILLHAEYTRTFTSCTRDEWLGWASSDRSQLHTFTPLRKCNHSVSSKREIEVEARRRGLRGELEFRYRYNIFQVEDWDFEPRHWAQWNSLARENERIWSEIVKRIVAQPLQYWKDSMNARCYQLSKGGTYQNRMTFENLLPSWILKLRELPCLPDTRGFTHKPAELFRRTRETEPLLDVEPFVDFRVDTPAMQPLLDMLGVQSTPTGPDRLLQRVRALAHAKSPPLNELEKWYRRLDKILDAGSTEDRQRIKEAFQLEKLIFAEDGTWQTSGSIFLSAGEADVPGAPVVHASVRRLALWARIDVAERPTVELALQWLKGLPSRGKLPSQDVKRVEALCARHPVRIWQECGHWMNLSGEWVPVSALDYALTMQSLVSWGHLHEEVKQRTADLKMLRADTTAAPPFAVLPTLGSCIENRLVDGSRWGGTAERKQWLEMLGIELRRIELDDEDEMLRIRSVADRLARTEWQRVQELQVIPYLDGKPVGTPVHAEVVWLDRVLYVADLPKGKLAKRVPEEIGRVFNRRDIQAALDYSFERPADDMRAYLQENFTLSATEQVGDAGVDRSEAAQRPRATSDIAGSQPALGVDASTDRVVFDSVAMPDFPPLQSVHVESDSPGADRHREERPTPRVSILERFALANGFRKVNEHRFVHADGTRIEKTDGIFPWEKRTTGGEPISRYWSRDHCLDQKPLEVPMEVWTSLEQNPGMNAFILADTHGEPIEVRGDRLLELKKTGRLKLYPATYRLVMEDNQGAF